MSYFTQRPTHRIFIDDEQKYYLDVYTKLTYGDRLEIGKFGGSLSELAGFAINLLIAGWNLDDESGVVLDPTPENIAKVDGAQMQPVVDYVDQLMTDYLNSLNPETKTDSDQKKSSSKKPSATSEPSPATE